MSQIYILRASRMHEEHIQEMYACYCFQKYCYCLIRLIIFNEQGSDINDVQTKRMNGLLKLEYKRKVVLIKSYFHIEEKEITRICAKVIRQNLQN